MQSKKFILFSAAIFLWVPLNSIAFMAAFIWIEQNICHSRATVCVLGTVYAKFDKASKEQSAFAHLKFWLEQNMK